MYQKHNKIVENTITYYWQQMILSLWSSFDRSVFPTVQVIKNTLCYNLRQAVTLEEELVG